MSEVFPYVLGAVGFFLVGAKAGFMWGCLSALKDGERDRLQAATRDQVEVAAPALLEALNFALVALQKIHDPIFTQRLAIQRAKSAITKALGGE